MKNCLEKTMAKLTEYRAVQHQGANHHYTTFYHAVYEYSVNGVTYTQVSRYGLMKVKQEVGIEVLLHYNKENPNLFLVEEDIRISKILSTVFLIVGGVSHVVTALLLVLFL